jgi:alpha-mannosidase
MALLDQGLTSHELNDQTVTLALLNAQSNYRNTPNELLRGLGALEFNYAILPHAGSWQEAQIPRRAWEFNAPVYENAGSRLEKPQSFLSTSDNLIVEAMRRVGRQIEVRLSEWSGAAGTGEVTFHLPHNGARLTNLMGEQGVVLAGGPTYRFPVRPQQIVTLRFDTSSGVQEPAPILSWKSLVPDEKQKALKVRLQAKGHPPRGY